MLTSSLTCLAVAVVLMTIVWLISIPMKRVSIIDAFWGPGFVVLVLACWCISAEPWQTPQWILAGMVGAWGSRLGWHLAIRCFGDEEEDRRYAAMRTKRGAAFWWQSLGVVFWLQALILWFVALPLQFALIRPVSGFSEWMAICAFVVWGTGLFFESIGDWQLSQFRANSENAGKVLNRGLWSLTRHPNYFGDFLVWWGFWLFSVALSVPVWTIVSPLLMAIFLIKFSGAGLLEKDIQTRRPEYAEYLRSTSAFFPWPRRRRRSNG